MHLWLAVDRGCGWLLRGLPWAAPATPQPEAGMDAAEGLVPPVCPSAAECGSRHATQPQGTQPALRQPRPLGSPALSFLGAQSFEDTPSGDLKPEARRLRAEGARLLPVLMIDSNSLGTAGAREEGPSWAGAACVLSALRARGRWVLPVGLRRALRL